MDESDGSNKNNYPTVINDQRSKIRLTNNFRAVLVQVSSRSDNKMRSLESGQKVMVLVTPGDGGTVMAHKTKLIHAIANYLIHSRDRSIDSHE